MRSSSVNRKLLFMFLCLAAASPFCAAVLQSARYLGIYVGYWNADSLVTLGARDAAYDVVRYARDATPPDSVFLVFRMSEFPYYAQRKCIFSVDPKTIPVYEQEDKQAAYRALREIGADYLYIPNYMLPEIANTCIAAVAGDPEISELVQFGRGYRLIRLREARCRVRRELLPIGASDLWLRREPARTPQPWLSLSAQDAGPCQSEDWFWEQDKDGQRTLTLVNRSGRERATVFCGFGARQYPATAYLRRAPVPRRWFDPESTYHFRAGVSGEGNFGVLLREYNRAGRSLGETVLWSSVLDARSREVQFLFRPRPETGQYRLLFYLAGEGRLSIRDIAVARTVLK